MDLKQVNELRKANAIPFRVVYWLEELKPVVEHEEMGTLYKGHILAEDGYGQYTAVIGTTDRWLKATDSPPLRVLKVEKATVA